MAKETRLTSGARSWSGSSSRQFTLSVQKALRILQAFSVDRPAQSLVELSNQTGLHTSTVHRLIATLESEGFLERVGGNGQYRLGMKMFELGSVVLHDMELNMASSPTLAWLATETGDTVYLTVLSDGGVLCLSRIEGARHMSAQFLEVGRRLPIHAGAASKVFLAHVPLDRAVSLLTTQPLIAYTDHTMTRPEDILNLLPAVRRNGYALSLEEITPGISSVATPVFDRSSQVVAALTLSGPSLRFEGDNRTYMVVKALEAAGDISVRLGYARRLNA